MERTPIESKTGMCGYAFDPATQVLEIEFKSTKEDAPNKVYQYLDFAQANFDSFMSAESKGSHFLRNIRPIFKCVKLEPPKEESNAANGA